MVKKKTPLSAPAHLRRLELQLDALEKAEQEKDAATDVLEEITAARKDAEGRLHQLIRRPHEVLADEDLDPDTDKPINLGSYLNEIRAAEGRLVTLEDQEKLARDNRAHLKKLCDKLVGDLRLLIRDPGAELLPFEEADVPRPGALEPVR